MELLKYRNFDVEFFSQTEALKSDVSRMINECGSNVNEKPC